MNYGETIVGAARLVWRHQHLWVLGVLLALLTGRCSGSFQVPSNISGSSGGRFDDAGRSGGLPEPFRSLIETDPGVLIGTFLVLIVVGVIVLVLWFIAGLILRPIARGGLAYSTNRLSEGLPSGFGTAWGGGWRRAGSLIGISLVLEFLPVFLLVLAIVILIAIVVGPLIAAGSSLEEGFNGLIAASVGTGLVAGCCLVVIAIPIAIVLGVLTELSSIASVIEARGVGSAIGRAWGLLRDRPGPLALIWLVTVAVNTVVGTAIAIPAVAIGAGLAFGLAGTNAPAFLWLLAGFFFVLFVLLALIVNGGITAYTVALWTLTFRSLTGDSRERLDPVNA